MLNPSTADELTNDPTIERCEKRAREYGYGGIKVTNLFALRSTDPAALHAAVDPIGPDNDEAILDAYLTSRMTICAWGTHGAHLDRGRKVTEMLASIGAELYALDLTKDGIPGHPLYLPYSLHPTRWMPTAQKETTR